MDALAASGKTMSDVQILRFYFTFEGFNGEKNIYIDNLRLEEKDAPATEETELASDLLAGALWYEGIEATLNTESTEVYGNQSIKSWNLHGNGGGWPHLQFQLDKGYDMTGKYLTFDIKVVNAKGQLVVFEVKDSNWSHVANGGKDHYVAQFETDKWVTVSIDMDALAASGKTMSDVQILRFYFTFEGFNGEKNIYIDNLRLVDKEVS